MDPAVPPHSFSLCGGVVCRESEAAGGAAQRVASLLPTPHIERESNEVWVGTRGVAPHESEA